jgi:hypothetical protein
LSIWLLRVVLLEDETMVMDRVVAVLVGLEQAQD